MNRSFIHEDLQEQRWVPPWLRYQNLARYRWATQFVSDKDVIEVGCGSGHGTQMLVEAGANTVRGFDLSDQAIEIAKEKYGTDRLSFEVAPGGNIPAEASCCDVCVSLETIEHIEDTDPYLDEVVRVLRPDGLFLCSTPNRSVTNPGKTIDDKPFNEHHVREYTASEFESELRRKFNDVRTLGQRPFGDAYLGLLSSLGKLSPTIAFRLHQFRKLALIPFEKFEKHVPMEMRPNEHPEVLVAVARK